MTPPVGSAVRRGGLVLGAVLAVAAGGARAVSADFRLVAQWGSSGTANGQFRVPEGIVVDWSGDVYVADQNNNRVQKFGSDGTFILAFSGPADPDLNHFNGPSHLALDPQGNVLVSNEGAYRVEKFSPSGAYLSTYGDLATFRDNPRGVAADSAGNVYVALSNAKQIDKFAPGGGLLTSWTTAVTTHQNVDLPSAVAVSPAGIVYVNDFNNGTVDEFTTDGRFVKEWSTQAFGTSLRGTPDSLALDSQGNVFVGDNRQGAIEKFSADGVIISSTRSTGEQPGDFSPQGVAVAASNDVFVTDLRQSRVLHFSQTGAATPPPVLGKSVDISTVSGTVLVRLRGTSTFAPLTASEQIPLGSELDATKGRVDLASAAASGKTQSADFYQGRFVVGQLRGAIPVTTLRLSQPLTCAKRRTSGGAAAAPQRARRLWGNGKGSFRTLGRYASATVRGTVWLTQDTCTATTVRVRSGHVDVLDIKLRKHFLLGPGQSHTAHR